MSALSAGEATAAAAAAQTAAALPATATVLRVKRRRGAAAPEEFGSLRDWTAIASSFSSSSYDLSFFDTLTFRSRLLPPSSTIKRSYSVIDGLAPQGPAKRPSRGIEGSLARLGISEEKEKSKNDDTSNSASSLSSAFRRVATGGRGALAAALAAAAAAAAAAGASAAVAPSPPSPSPAAETFIAIKDSAL